jgi:hypothetical protein
MSAGGARICGNSFHRVLLKPGEYWQFPARLYQETFKTKRLGEFGPDAKQSIPALRLALKGNDLSLRVEASAALFTIDNQIADCRCRSIVAHNAQYQANYGGFY